MATAPARARPYACAHLEHEVHEEKGEGDEGENIDEEAAVGQLLKALLVRLQ